MPQHTTFQIKKEYFKYSCTICGTWIKTFYSFNAGQGPPQSKWQVLLAVDKQWQAVLQALLWQLTHQPACWCAGRRGPASRRGRWAARSPCPSCTRRRWCCTGTAGSAPRWTRRSWSGTSSTEAQAWSGGNHHCPAEQHKKKIEYYRSPHLIYFNVGVGIVAYSSKLNIILFLQAKGE